MPEPTSSTPSLDPEKVATPAEEPTVQFEMLNREWQNMAQQDNWDGFRLEGANQVTKCLQAAHTLFLGTQLRECGYIYQFGPAFQSEDQRTMLVARAGLDGAVNGRAIQKLGQCLELKGSSNSHLGDPKRNMHEGSFEYNGMRSAWGAKVAWQGAWLLGGAWTQRIVPSLTVGGDMTFVMVNGIMPIGQVGARWQEGKDIFTAAVSRQPDPSSFMQKNLYEFRLHYVRKITERLSLGSEFKFSSDKESGMEMAYEYTFRNARVQGLLDTDGKVSCCVSDFTGVGFSGSIDYAKGDYKFGVMMHVLPAPEQQPQAA